MNSKNTSDKLQNLPYKFEKFIRSIAFDFAILNFDESENLINKHLAAVCEFIKMQRALIVLYDHQKKTRHFAFEYLGPDVKVKESLVGMVSSYENQSILTETLLMGKVFRIKQIAEIPDHFSKDISLMKSLAIESYFAVPIIANGKVIGSVGLGSEFPVPNNISEEVLDLELDLVSTFAKILASYLTRKQIQDDLVKEQNLLNSIMVSSTTAILMLDTTGKIIYANPVSEFILGISITDIVNRTYDAPQWKATSIDGGPWTDEDQPFTRVLKSKKPVTDIRHAIEDFSGNKKYLSINGSPILNTLGEIVSLVFLVTDISENVLKEKALLESEFRYRTIAESSMSLVYDLDLNSMEISWAGAVQEMTGFMPEEYSNVNLSRWKELIHPEDRKLVEDTLNQCINEKQKFSLEYRYQKKDGSYLHVEDQGVFIYDLNNIPYRMLGAVVDRTERYQAHQELKNQEETLRLALQSASMGIWIWNIESQKITWSPRVFEIFKQSTEYFSGNFEDMLKLIHPEDRELVIETINKLITITNDTETNDFLFQHRLSLGDSEVRYVESTGRLFRNRNGSPQKIIGTVSDITERKRFENTLKQSEQRFQTFYHFSKEAIIIFREKNLEIVDVNQAFLNLFNVEKSELGNRNFKKMISTQTFRGLRQLIRKESGKETLEVIAYKKGLIPFPAQVIATRYLENEEILIAFNIIDTSAFKEVVELRQINEEINIKNRLIEHQKTELQLALDNLKKTQSQLVQSEKMALLGQLIAGVAHEINNPIGAIRASNQNLEQWGTRFKDIYESVNTAYKTLNQSEKALFGDALTTTINSKEFFTGLHERKLKKTNVEILSSLNYSKENRFEIADKWVEIGIGLIEVKFYELISNDHINLFLEYFSLESVYSRNTRTIHTAIDRVSKIIYALKNFSHIDKIGQKERTSIYESLEVVYTIYHNQLNRGIELVKDYEEIPEIVCFPDDLLHIWTNLIYNAFQAMNFKGTLTIRIRNHENEISVAVIDTGTGIAPELQDQIFEPFFTTKKAGEGSGLGLDITKKIVDKHQGRIELNSKPGHTEFVIYLPK